MKEYPKYEMPTADARREILFLPEEPLVALFSEDDAAAGVVPGDGPKGDLDLAEEGDLHLLQGFLGLITLPKCRR